MGYSDFANIFSEKTTFKPVVFKESGKIPAIKHVNAFFNLGRPLPLLSTKNYVEQIESSINNE